MELHSEEQVITAQTVPFPPPKEILIPTCDPSLASFDHLNTSYYKELETEVNFRTNILNEKYEDFKKDQLNYLEEQKRLRESFQHLYQQLLLKQKDLDHREQVVADQENFLKRKEEALSKREQNIITEEEYLGTLRQVLTQREEFLNANEKALEKKQEELVSSQQLLEKRDQETPTPSVDKTLSPSTSKKRKAETLLDESSLINTALDEFISLKQHLSCHMKKGHYTKDYIIKEFLQHNYPVVAKVIHEVSQKSSKDDYVFQDFVATLLSHYIHDQPWTVSFKDQTMNFSFPM